MPSIKKFQCRDCGKKYCTLWTIRRHIDNNHSFLKYQCKICDKRMRRRDNKHSCDTKYGHVEKERVYSTPLSDGTYDERFGDEALTLFRTFQINERDHKIELISEASSSTSKRPRELSSSPKDRKKKSVVSQKSNKVGSSTKLKAKKKQGKESKSAENNPPASSVSQAYENISEDETFEKATTEVRFSRATSPQKHEFSCSESAPVSIRSFPSSITTQSQISSHSPSTQQLPPTSTTLLIPQSKSFQLPHLSLTPRPSIPPPSSSSSSTPRSSISEKVRVSISEIATTTSIEQFIKGFTVSSSSTCSGTVVSSVYTPTSSSYSGAVKLTNLPLAVNKTGQPHELPNPDEVQGNIMHTCSSLDAFGFSHSVVNNITNSNFDTELHYTDPVLTIDDQATLTHLKYCAEQKVTMNIGGNYYHASIPTLKAAPNSLFCKMLHRDSPYARKSSIFIDRDSKHFDIILNFLRNGGKINKMTLPGDLRQLYELRSEAVYYQLQGLVRIIDQRLTSLFGLPVLNE